MARNFTYLTFILLKKILTKKLIKKLFYFKKTQRQNGNLPNNLIFNLNKLLKKY